MYFRNRTLHVSERFSVRRQDSSTVYTEIGICHTGYADCLLAVCTVYGIYSLYSTRILMMDRKPFRNM